MKKVDDSDKVMKALMTCIEKAPKKFRKVLSDTLYSYSNQHSKSYQNLFRNPFLSSMLSAIECASDIDCD
jgi:hypothetical protein